MSTEIGEFVPSQFNRPNIKDFRKNVSCKVKNVLSLDKSKRSIYFSNVEKLQKSLRKDVTFKYAPQYLQDDYF